MFSYLEMVIHLNGPKSLLFVCSCIHLLVFFLFLHLSFCLFIHIFLISLSVCLYIIY